MSNMREIGHCRANANNRAVVRASDGAFAQVTHFDRPDALAGKYPHISPYAFCANNPVNVTDPTGMVVVAYGKAKENILNTLNPRDAKFVVFDNNGYLDMNVLSGCHSESPNMQALKTLAASEIEYHVEVSFNDSEGILFTDGKQNGGINEYKGVTELPGADRNASPDKNVYVKTSVLLDDLQQVKNTAHELFGHAYFYELFRDVSKAIHQRGDNIFIGTEWDEEFSVPVPIYKAVRTNQELEGQIKRSENEAAINYFLNHE